MFGQTDGACLAPLGFIFSTRATQSEEGCRRDEEAAAQQNQLRSKGLAFVSQPGGGIRNDFSLSCLPPLPLSRSLPRSPLSVALICNVNSFGNQAGAALALSECLHVRSAPGTH